MRIEDNEFKETNTENHIQKTSIVQPLLIAALVVAFGAIAFMQVGAHHDQQRLDQAIAELSDKNQARMDAMEERAKSLEQDTSVLHDATSSTSHAIQDTQKRMALTRRATDQQIKKVSEEATEKMTTLAEQAQQQDAKLGEVNTEVSSVKGSLDDTKTNLNGVSSKLEQAVGDLGVHSGLIARNHDELADLRRKGERDYAEFDIKKTKDFTRVSDLSLRLTKADTGHQKYSMAVMVADKNLQKNDKTALEPVQLYLPGGRKLVEIVVWDVNKDRVTGYVSSPKS